MKFYGELGCGQETNWSNCFTFWCRSANSTVLYYQSPLLANSSMFPLLLTSITCNFSAPLRTCPALLNAHSLLLCVDGSAYTLLATEDNFGIPFSEAWLILSGLLVGQVKSLTSQSWSCMFIQRLQYLDNMRKKEQKFLANSSGIPARTRTRSSVSVPDPYPWSLYPTRPVPAGTGRVRVNPRVYTRKPVGTGIPAQP